MKKFWKGAVCVLLILLCVLGIAAKYDTRGITPELVEDLRYESYISQKTQELSYREIWGIKRNGYFIFPNRFGSAVVAEVTHSNSMSALSVKLYEQIGPAILRVRTVPGNGTPTHLDFWQVENGVTTIYELISISGFPTDMCNGGLADYQYKTADGYVYEIAVYPETGTVKNLSIVKPNGSLMTDEERPMFWLKVILHYLALAAALSGILVVLLTVPNAIRKRKAKKLLKQEG